MNNAQDLYQFRFHRNDIALVSGHQWKQVSPLIDELTDILSYGSNL
ncbi:hypothetical protein OSCI_360006 [Kamptonema sp. PCC 6506]|nr:hypothetical protein [Kamptonema formosum]CBN53928.1 hypothetical protein OSCI_360006 [Kamptonema sp. PCC 6506]